MTTIYLETSAVLSWFLEQRHFQKIMEWIDGSEQVLTSVLTIMEAKRAFSRLERASKTPSRSGGIFLGKLERRIFQWNLFEITPDIQKRVGEPFPHEPIRTLDAIHLATALEATKDFSDLKVLSLDQKILENLDPLGLEAAQL